MTEFASLLIQLDACPDAVEWVGNRDLATAWAECYRGDWMLWLAARVGVDRRIVVRAACACARTALHYVSTGDDRPRVAIETAEAWSRGEATLEEARDAAKAAYASAKDAAYVTVYDAKATAYDAIYAAKATAYAAAYAANASNAAANASNAAANAVYAAYAANATYAAYVDADAAHATIVCSIIATNTILAAAAGIKLEVGS